MAVLGLIFFTLGSMVGLTLIRGLVLQALWGWFIVTTFALPDLTLVQALGLSLVVSFLTMQLENDDPKNDTRSAGEKAAAGVFIGLFFYGIVFVMGAVIHAFA
jgi:hypothetical protein